MMSELTRTVGLFALLSLSCLRLDGISAQEQKLTVAQIFWTMNGFDYTNIYSYDQCQPTQDATWNLYSSLADHSSMRITLCANEQSTVAQACTPDQDALVLWITAVEGETQKAQPKCVCATNVYDLDRVDNSSTHEEFTYTCPEDGIPKCAQGQFMRTAGGGSSNGNAVCHCEQTLREIQLSCKDQQTCTERTVAFCICNNNPIDECGEDDGTIKTIKLGTDFWANLYCTCQLDGGQQQHPQYFAKITIVSNNRVERQYVCPSFLNKFECSSNYVSNLMILGSENTTTYEYCTQCSNPEYFNLDMDGVPSIISYCHDGTLAACDAFDDSVVLELTVQPSGFHAGVTATVQCKCILFKLKTSNPEKTRFEYTCLRYLEEGCQDRYISQVVANPGGANEATYDYCPDCPFNYQRFDFQLMSTVFDFSSYTVAHCHGQDADVSMACNPGQVVMEMRYLTATDSHHRIKFLCEQKSQDVVLVYAEKNEFNTTLSYRQRSDNYPQCAALDVYEVLISTETAEYATMFCECPEEDQHVLFVPSFGGNPEMTAEILVCERSQMSSCPSDTSTTGALVLQGTTAELTSGRQTCRCEGNLELQTDASNTEIRYDCNPDGS